MFNFLGGLEKKGETYIFPKKKVLPSQILQNVDEKTTPKTLPGMKIMQHFVNKRIDAKNIHPMDLLSAVQYCQEAVKDDHLNQENKELIRLFFQKIAHLPSSLFDRKKVLGGHEKLQRVISQDLDKLMKAQEESPSLMNDRKHQFAISVAKAELAFVMGVSLKSTGKGANGAAFVMSLEGKYLGVFKAPAKLGVKEKLKLVVGQARLLNFDDPLGREFSEVAAAKFDDIFGFGFSPEAKMMSFGDKEGAFLEFLGGYLELSSVKQLFNGKERFFEDEIIQWQMMCLHQLLIGNMDPHDENIFVQVDENGILKKIAVIDHGNSFIESNPGIGPKGNQGCWRKYKISKQKFHPQVLEFIRKNLDKEHVEQFIDWVKKERGIFWNDKMDAKIRQRFALMEKILDGTIATPRQLGSIHTNEDFKKYL